VVASGPVDMAGWSLAVTARSETGPVRSHNEDCYALRTDLGLWVVADGMGGLARGDLASRAVCTAVTGLPAGLTGADLRTAFARAIGQVHARLLAEQISFGPSGTTVVALLFENGRYRVFWAGDSRAGRLRAGRLEWLTVDHNLAARMVQLGRMSDEEARRHPLASRLTRAVGIGEELELDEVAGRIEAGDLFILCSDGLTGELGDAEIAAALAGDEDLERAADELCDLAVRRRHARDNVTFVLVKVLDGVAGRQQG